MNHDKGKIRSIQALRAFAFLGIFLCHADASYIQWPALGVSIFFVLSGFLLYYHYDDTEMDLSFKGSASFSFQKIRKLYPLHLITMCFAAFLYLANCLFSGFTFYNIFYLFAAVLCNVTLLQTWVPNHAMNVSLNGVAWYLSVAMFLYFVFPNLKKFIKNRKNGFLFLSCIGILGLEIFLCFLWIIFAGSDSQSYQWFMYCFPIFRLGDFFTGCVLGKYYVQRKEKGYSADFIKASALEILAAILTVLVLLWMRGNSQNPLLTAAKNWTTLYIPLAAIWTLLFAGENGFITKLLTNKLTVYIGNLSAYLFLIHYVIAQYFRGAIIVLHLQLSLWENIIKIAAEFCITMIATFLYMKYFRKRKSGEEQLQKLQ